MRDPVEKVWWSRRVPARALWISWLLVFAIVLKGSWLPFHLATEDHLGIDHSAAGADVALFVAHVSADHDEHASGSDDDHGLPHDPHPAIEHKVPLARAGAATDSPKLFVDAVVLSADLPDALRQPHARRPPETRSTGPPDDSCHSPRLPRAPPAS